MFWYEEKKKENEIKIKMWIGYFTKILTLKRKKKFSASNERNLDNFSFFLLFPHTLLSPHTQPNMPSL